MRVIWTTSTVSRCSKRTMSTSSPNVGASAVTVMPRTSLSQVIYVSPSNRHRLPRLWYAHLGNHLRGQHRPDAGYQALIDQYTGNLERDQAQFINAQANLTRYSQLGDKGWATPQLIETQKAQVGQLQAAIKADQALIDAAKVQLGFTRLTSPIDGVVGIRQIDVGNIISPSTTNGLVVVTQLDPISLIFTLPETNLPQIQQQQQKTNAPLAVLAYSQDDTTLLDQGVLGLVNNEILQTTGSIQLKANFPNKSRRLWPGELVNARLLVDTRHDGLTVAASAVQQGPSGAYVYVVDPNNTVESRPVKVAEISGGQALIDSGLKANEQVVVDGQYKLQPGTRVTMLHGQAAQEAIAQSAQQAPIP